MVPKVSNFLFQIFASTLSHKQFLYLACEDVTFYLHLIWQRQFVSVKLDNLGITYTFTTDIHIM